MVEDSARGEGKGRVSKRAFTPKPWGELNRWVNENPRAANIGMREGKWPGGTPSQVIDILTKSTPKERDLVFFLDKSVEFTEGYSSVVGEVSINEEVVDFYLHEWNVQEVADFGASILFEKHGELQNRYDVDKTKEFLEYFGISKN